MSVPPPMFPPVPPPTTQPVIYYYNLKCLNIIKAMPMINPAVPPPGMNASIPPPNVPPPSTNAVCNFFHSHMLTILGYCPNNYCAPSYSTTWCSSTYCHNGCKSVNSHLDSFIIISSATDAPRNAANDAGDATDDAGNASIWLSRVSWHATR